MSKEKGNVMKEIVKPIVVLTLICLVCSAALAFTYQTTKPTIEATAAREAEQARTEVFPEATGFTQYEGELPANAKEIYLVNGGEGCIITATTKGFGGPVEVMVALTADGSIQGMKVLDVSKETSGLGTQVANADYQANYIGRDNVDDVETISGATVTSSAFKKLIQDVLVMGQTVMGGAEQ